MIGYATLGSNDLERAWAFYDKVLAPLGGKRLFASPRMQFYGSDAQPGMIAVGTPFDTQAATVGNGSMFGLVAPSDAKVDEVHAVALAAGATCEGPPGPRTDEFYGAYFRDLDGNKICVFRFG